MCHSLGGIIARACLKYLQSHKSRFNNFVTICSPHLGYLYHSSTLISTSLWILNKVKKDPSMIELTMSDSNELDVLVSVCRKLTCMGCLWVNSWIGLSIFGCLGLRKTSTYRTGLLFCRLRILCLRPSLRRFTVSCYRTLQRTLSLR